MAQGTTKTKYRTDMSSRQSDPVTQPESESLVDQYGGLMGDDQNSFGGTSAPTPIMGPSYKSTANPVEAAQGQRDMIRFGGDKLNQQSEDDYWRAAGREKDYSGRVDPVAQNWMDGGGGYNDEEKARIYQDGKEGENYLTGDEQRAASGDTESWGKYFNPEGMEGAQQDSAGLQRGAAQRLNERVTSAVNPDQIRQSEGYRAKSQQSLKDNRKGTWDTILGNADNVRGAIDSEGQNVRGAIDPSAVQASQGFLDDYNMSPQEQQDLVESAGISSGTGYRAATGELQRRALAAGASPMGVAAYRSRMERQASGDAADAMTKARVAASQEEARRKMEGEQLRESGGRYLTDTKVGSELDLGRQRSAAEQAMGDRAITSQMRLGENELAQANEEEKNRQGTEQYLTEAQTRAAQIGSGAELNTEGNINNQQRQVGQFNTTTGTDIARGQDQASSDRAYRAGANRQGVSMQNQQNASTRGQVVGNARIGQQNTGMGVLQQQGQQQNQNAENARNRQQQTYATETAGTNTATAIGAQADDAAKSRPSTWQKVLGGVTSGIEGATGLGGAVKGVKAAASYLADGGVVGLDGPELAVVGEEGPEIVSPVGYRASAKVRPSVAMGQEQVRRPRFYGQAA